uniref:Uncharacterized protein n=1 Tax=Anopheles maculatus TaxID=74869 RepID=A0A182SV03_9DIPT
MMKFMLPTTTSSHVYNIPSDEEWLEETIQDAEELEESVINSENDCQSIAGSYRGVKRASDRNDKALKRRVLNLVASRLESPSANNALVNHIQEELQLVPPEMMPIVKKLFSEVLMQAQTKSLNTHSIIYTPEQQFIP